MATQHDYYALLKIPITATKQEITKAYKKLALETHPDKNKDNPKANEIFLLVKEAYTILCDDEARKAYDTVIKAKIEREKRDLQMDAKRRKMKRDLEEREERAKRKREEAEAEVNLKKKVEEIRRANQEQMERMKAQQQSEMKEKAKTSLEGALTISWTNKNAYSTESLKKIFSMFGNVQHISVKKKSALVVFEDVQSAILASKQVLGDASDRLQISWASGSPPKVVTEKSSENFSQTKPKPVSIEEHTNFEDEILKKMMERAKSRKVE